VPSALDLASELFNVDDEALAHCASEPIHVPGSIQPRGVLIALDAQCERVLVASENVAKFFRLPVDAVVGNTAAAVFGPDIPARIRTLLATAREGAVLSLGSADEFVGSDVFVHRFDGRVIVEIVDEFDEAPTERVLVHAIQAFAQARAHGATTLPRQEQGVLGIAAGFQRVAATLAVDPELMALCASIAQEVRTITGYDRAMVYRFDSHGHGAVIAEAKRDDLEAFLGLHYPASDIPAQARALYLQTRVRVLESAHEAPMPLVAADTDEARRPLDLSRALLRSMSPIHLQYLRNMGVEATLVVSIIVDGKLWGLVSCHHLTRKWPTFATRVACDMLSEFVSVQVTVLENFARAAALSAATNVQRKVIQRLVVSGGLLEEVLDELHALIASGGGGGGREGSRAHLRHDTLDCADPQPRRVVGPSRRITHFRVRKPARGRSAV
jgi:light-regulated signal transduction histidine kinase (bacteriophytochrome)